MYTQFIRDKLLIALNNNVKYFDFLIIGYFGYMMPKLYGPRPNTGDEPDLCAFVFVGLQSHVLNLSCLLYSYRIAIVAVTVRHCTAKELQGRLSFREKSSSDQQGYSLSCG